ncbi:MAG: hypothetical protein AAF571_09805 [Verrucomicrobiota bacterium]
MIEISQRLKLTAGLLTAAGGLSAIAIALYVTLLISVIAAITGFLLYFFGELFAILTTLLIVIAELIQLLIPFV